jgi:hypothetical protein
VSLPSQQGDDAPLAPAPADPAFVLVERHGGKVDVDAQLMAGEEEILEHRGIAVPGGDLDQNAQRKIVVDDRLANVENDDPVLGQHRGHARRQPGLIAAGDVDEDDLRHRSGVQSLCRL